MVIDYAGKTKIELDSLIANNHPDRRGKNDRFLAAQEERERRYPGGLNFEKTLDIVTRAAKEGRCVSYKDISTESGVTFNKVHWSMAGHLGRLIRYGRAKGLPMLNAVVVNEAEKATGKLKPESLKGFAEIARELGYKFDDEEEFFESQQQAVFKAAAEGKLG